MKLSTKSLQAVHRRIAWTTRRDSRAGVAPFAGVPTEANPSGPPQTALGTPEGSGGHSRARVLLVQFVFGSLPERHAAYYVCKKCKQSWVCVPPAAVVGNCTNVELPGRLTANRRLTKVTTTPVSRSGSHPGRSPDEVQPRLLCARFGNTCRLRHRQR